MPARIEALINSLYRSESRRVLASLIRLLKDFDLAEEATQEAFTAALHQWPHEGVPQNPRAWLVSTGRFKAIDQLRRRARFQTTLDDVVDELEEAISDGEDWDEQLFADDQLRLIFTCCHPSLAPEAQLALTLREVCGLTTEAIARAFLTTPSTLAQRIVRAKAKIRDANIPYEIPGREQLPERLSAVLRVIYLVFNEGYSASSGENLIRHDLTLEAIRLGRLLVQLMPEPEAQGLLALMLIQQARAAARQDEQGDLIRLEDQDRRLWNHAQIAEGSALIRQAFNRGGAGIYSVQAAIAAVHGESPSFAQTDWHEIVGLYDLLLRLTPSPIVELNRAVAVAMRDGPASGLSLIEALAERGHLKDYYLFHAARADLLQQLGQLDAAQQAYRLALALTEQAAEQRFLQRRLTALGAG
ncbi:RNA polymerase sigma factor [Cellvibrio japonicus]|uniref:RNA polymerase sigma factor, sigma-70 family n=1 Tax=Cellvibrio japonicus (strain Ueda107) TaxID=498211 RepID=B3PD66_CELJU|nr:RNA polymerase sigma factor [Cellvibrio japonicus]ACE85006.1 RNA polymerase sigma factor, sigma-70 family [Cellvibrio japonicus Ueda107]QEI13331.1 RNA polymerase sigma factor [Cellvibrio japonicus]QEI16905.1 RNA polymerase sigma factor [Cellvibrio japonicus]QEI20483.1 RNA polymerase sigma factor [Cellvibrio japonicus]